MPESGISRQRSNEREEQRGGHTQQSSGGIQRRGGFLPTAFPLSPRDFFTLSPLGLMRRVADEIEPAFSDLGVSSTRPSQGPELGRKSVVEGKRVDVRGRRIISKKKVDAEQ